MGKHPCFLREGIRRALKTERGRGWGSCRAPELTKAPCQARYLIASLCAESQERGALIGREEQLLDNITRTEVRQRKTKLTWYHLCVLIHFSQVQLYATLWTIAHQAPLSMGPIQAGALSRLPCLPAGDFPNSGNEPASPMVPALQADLQILYHWATGKAPGINYIWDLKIIQMNDYAKQIQAHRLRK